MGGITPVERLPGWVTLLRAPNPGPMTLDGTNTWILRAPGDELGVVIDPGPLDEGHLARIAELGPYRSILVTHGHHDHVEGVPRLTELLGGEQPSADDGALDIQVLRTPGHTGDSVCYLIEHAGEQVVLTGDTILGRGSTVVAWPDGDLGDYLTSLRLLAAYDGLVLLPGHGPALNDCGAVARAYLEHREIRLTQVRAALAAGADTPDAIVDVVYPDIDPAIRFAAVASAGAQLDFLRRESQPVPEQLDPL